MAEFSPTIAAMNFEARRVDNSDMPNQLGGMEHWVCVLSDAGGNFFEFPVSLDPGQQEPTAEMAAGFLAADIASYLEHTDPESWVAAVAADTLTDHEAKRYLGAHEAIGGLVETIDAIYGREWLMDFIGQTPSTAANPAI